MVGGCLCCWKEEEGAEADNAYDVSGVKKEKDLVVWRHGVTERASRRKYVGAVNFKYCILASRERSNVDAQTCENAY